MTRYLRDRLRTHPPSEDNLDLYADLLKLERLVADGPPYRAGAGWVYAHLSRTYPEAARAFLAELQPERFRALEESRRKARREARVVAARDARERAQARRRLLTELRAESLRKGVEHGESAVLGRMRQGRSASRTRTCASGIPGLGFVS